MKTLLAVLVCSLAFAAYAAAPVEKPLHPPTVGKVPKAHPMKGAHSAVMISVTEEGFTPAEVRVKQGKPVTLAVTRKVERSCATELVLKEYGINQPLPLNETVAVKFTPTKAGTLTYACAMGHIKGTIVVE